MQKLTKIFLCTIFLIAVIFATTYAEIPKLINYQGRLTDSGGKPLDGAYKLNFKLYNSAGTLLWQGTHNSVLVQKGVFSVLLGDANDAPYNFSQLAFDEPYFLEIKVCKIEGANETCEVLSPRQQITSAGYAFMAENVLSIPRGVIVLWSGRILDIPSGWALCDGTNGTPDLREKFVVGAGQDEGGTAKTNITGTLTKEGGNPSHAHTFSASTERDNTPQAAVRNDYQNVAVSQNQHTHTVSGATNSASVLPPYYALAFIMKID